MYENLSVRTHISTFVPRRRRNRLAKRPFGHTPPDLNHGTTRRKTTFTNRRSRRSARLCRDGHRAAAHHRALQLLLLPRHLAAMHAAQLHRQGHLGRALLHLRRQGLRHLRPALRIQFLHSGRQPTPPRTRFQTQVLLAAGATLRAGKHQRRILHGRSARIVLPRGVRAGSHMPHVGPRGIHHSHRLPAAAAALDISHPRGRRPGIHPAQYPHRRAVERDHGRTEPDVVPRNGARKPRAGTARKPRMGVGQRPFLPDGRALHVRHAHRPPRPLHRAEGRLLAQGAGMVARGILSTLRPFGHAARLQSARRPHSRRCS